MNIGRIDILFKTPLLSSYLSITHIGNHENSLQMFGYLKSHPKSKFGFDPVYPAINENVFRILTGKSFIGMPVKRSR